MSREHRNDWRPVPGYEGLYSVNSEGAVRRDVRSSKGNPAGMLMKTTEQGGYHRLQLGPKRKHWFIHQLVATVFIGPRPPKHQINHKNGNPSDNRVENLEWVTSKQNHAHAVAELGRDQRGERNAYSKITADVVSAIRSEYSYRKNSSYSLGQKYGISQRHAIRIVKGERWGHLPHE